MRYTLFLDKIKKAQYKNIGGKAMNLARLCQYDFCVPQGFCLTVDAYKQFIRDNKLNSIINQLLESANLDENKDIGHIGKQIQTHIKESPIPVEIVEEIREACKKISFDRFVVRSSASAEDLDDASFAGQYDSYLNLQEIDDILTHIKKCYASLWTPRAISYRIKNKISLEEIDIAVMVQEMVPARTSGVLFTVNPVTGESTEMLIESNFGLGESVMSGHSTPDQFVLKWNEKKPGSIQILKKQIGEKKFIIQAKGNGEKKGTKKVKISKAQAKKASLTKTQLSELAQLGYKIQDAFEKPQDIEWAIDAHGKIHVLQTRPITALEEEKAPETPSETWYSRGYSDDYWNDPVSPLFFDLLGDQLTKVVNIELNSIMGYQRMDEKLLKLHKGHVYFNLDVLKRKVEYEIPQFIRNENILNYFPKGSGPYGKKTVKNLDFHLIPRIVAELRIMLFDPQGSMTKTDQAYYKWTEQEFIPFCEQFDLRLENLKEKSDMEELFELANDLDDVMIGHFKLVRYGIPVHNIGMNLMSQYLLTRFIGKKEASKHFPILISGINHKLTQTNEQIYDLAAMIHHSEKVKKIILNTKSPDLMGRLSKKDDPEVKQFLNSFRTFLEECGHRGFTREPYYPRWEDEPKFVFDILKSLLKGKGQNWERKKHINRLRTRIVERKVEKKIRAQFLGLIKWKLFSIILKFSRRYIRFRENQRYNLDIWITKNRNVFLEIGRILTKEGILECKSDIFFLRKREIRPIIRTSIKKEKIEKLKRKIEERKDIFLEYENSTPPKFIMGTNEYDDIEGAKGDDMIFHGIPASQGINTGEVLVLKEISDIPKVKSGDILVVPRTDPGWTPVFSTIGGLITETGGVLSHGAVVSREYNIPAVTNIPNATCLFKSGQRVQINGFNGEVSIISK